MFNYKDFDVVTDYGIYMDCAEGKLEEACKVEIPMTFWEFREKLSEKMPRYKTIHCLYPEDDRMHIEAVNN